MPLKIYGHPWSINTRKALLTLAEKESEAELVTVVLPKGEHKEAAHLARHPFAKVPVLDDDGFVLYESTAIMRYLDRKLAGTSLVPADPHEAARVEQWIHVADSYFVQHAGAFLVETLFRRYLGGQPNTALIASSREAMAHPLDVADARLAEVPYFAGASFTLADIHWMPYLEYLVKTGQAELVTRRPHLSKWWDAVSRRDTWQRVGRTGPQPYES